MELHYILQCGVMAVIMVTALTLFTKIKSVLGIVAGILLAILIALIPNEHTPLDAKIKLCLILFETFGGWLIGSMIQATASKK